MHEDRKEARLRKTVAVTGFLFALSVLPLAQYVLKRAERPAGEVAGVTSDTALRAAVPEAPEACEARKRAELAQLPPFEDGKAAALARTYDASVKPYRDAIVVLRGSEAEKEAERLSLEQLIADETAPYQTKRAELSDAVDRQAKEISARGCL